MNKCVIKKCVYKWQLFKEATEAIFSIFFAHTQTNNEKIQKHIARKKREYIYILLHLVPFLPQEVMKNKASSSPSKTGKCRF